MAPKARKRAPRPSPASTSAAILNVLERIHLRMVKMEMATAPKPQAARPHAGCSTRRVFTPRLQRYNQKETLNYYRLGFGGDPGEPCGQIYIPKTMMKEPLVLRFEPLCP